MQRKKRTFETERQEEKLCENSVLEGDKLSLSKAPEKLWQDVITIIIITTTTVLMVAIITPVFSPVILTATFTNITCTCLQSLLSLSASFE